jgi:Rad3-related DNA helicase
MQATTVDREALRSCGGAERRVPDGGGAPYGPIFSETSNAGLCFCARPVFGAGLMDFDLDQRTATLSVGEFSAFTTGPRDGGGGFQGLWRAQLGTHWHNELRLRAAADAPATEFEVVVEGGVFHRGWTLRLNGRIDQLVREPAAMLLREIKTVTRPLPADETELRAAYPEYFAQLAAYVSLLRITDADAQPPMRIASELVFVEAGSGLAQTLSLSAADDAFFNVQLERVVEFLNLRLRARERLRGLSFRPAFATARPGQETTQSDLRATFERRPLVFFEAPTGFGKTGVLLEFALGQLRAGHFDRALYLTSKSTGQLQVVSTLNRMTTSSAENADTVSLDSATGNISSHRVGDAIAPTGASSTPVTVWHVRNKGEHCINDVFHCVRESCGFLDQLETRWPRSGLARFYLDEKHPRDLDTLREAGRAARICPYEITRASLAFNDVWIGDYNYVFAPANRGLFFLQPGFSAARSLLIIDEAHNLPSRVADAHSHAVRANDASALLAELDHLDAPKPLLRAWENWTMLLSAMRKAESLDPALEADVADSLTRIMDHLGTMPLDYAALGPGYSDQIWKTQTLLEWLGDPQLKKLLWCPADGELSFTCIDAADAIGSMLREFGGVVCASATFGPENEFAAACGLSRMSGEQQPGTPHLALTESTAVFGIVRAATPWREGAYDVAVDARVDTTFQQRARHYATTASTVVALQSAARSAIAVFFPSYAYAETIAREVERLAPLRIALQPRLRDLATQSNWVEESLAFSDALFLVLGSSFAESIDLLGGRVSHAMVVGPALPEVNAVQRAKLAEFTSLGREAAFRRVYQIPGMTKVNQALGRLVRAPGQRARVLLHCRRFLDPGYASLLAADYQFGANLLSNQDFEYWLEHPRVSYPAN